MHGIVDEREEKRPAVVKSEATKEAEMKMWNGIRIPAKGSWDFYGLKVPAKMAYDKTQLRTDYDVSALNVTKPPKGYEYGKNPAYRYPDQEDRLFITVSLKPRILFFPKFVTDEEAQAVIDDCAPKLIRSQVALSLKHKAGESATQEVRTSKSTWLPLDGKHHNIENRAKVILGSKWHEPMNVLHYGIDQHYDAHHDYFDPNMYGQQTSNRMATLFIYLNDTEAGGATTVPRANGGRHPANFKEASCNQGLQVYPRRGSAFVLYDMRPDRSLDPFSLHGGCDVKSGTKWGGVIWFRTNTPVGTGSAHE